MGVDLYQPFTNPVTRETFRCLRSNEEAYITAWIVQAGGCVPIEHIHPNQDEILHIEQGEVRVRLNGRDRIGVAGQTVTIPRGARHIACNPKWETLRGTLEYRPGLDSYKLFQCFGGLTLDGDIGSRGLVNVAKMLYFMQRMGVRATARPAFVPDPVFNLFKIIFFVAGSVAGWERLYRRYTE